MGTMDLVCRCRCRDRSRPVPTTTTTNQILVEYNQQLTGNVNVRKADKSDADERNATQR